MDDEQDHNSYRNRFIRSCCGPCWIRNPRYVLGTKNHRFRFYTMASFRAAFYL